MVTSTSSAPTTVSGLSRAQQDPYYNAWTWHHSKGNQTDGIRRAFIVSYQEATVPSGAGEQWKILRTAEG